MNLISSKIASTVEEPIEITNCKNLIIKNLN